MSLRIGDIPEERMGDALRAFATALQFGALSETRFEQRRPSFFTEHAVGAYDGDRIVGHTGCLSFETMVPGGALVPTGGLSRVGVLPTHRRRGLLTGMMNRSLRKSKERGELIGSLRAAESAIYGRFGYGLAGLSAAVKIRTANSAFAVPIEVPGHFELHQGPALLADVKRAYERCLVRPGMLTRPGWYWEIVYDTHLAEAPTDADWGVVHYDTKGRPDGFVGWQPTDRDAWETKGAAVEVSDLFGADAAIETALWRFVLDLDLVEWVTAEGRPLDDPLRHRLANARAYETTSVWDEQWVRVIDVMGALNARTYISEERVVLEITGDTALPENEGRYEVTASGVRRVKRSADLAVPIAALGAAYLGGTSWRTLVQAGQVAELRTGAVPRADALFASPVAPWCGTFF